MSQFYRKKAHYAFPIWHEAPDHPGAVRCRNRGRRAVCPEAAAGIDDGDQVEVDFDSGIIKNLTKGTEYKGQAFPPFMQKIIACEGLVNYINQK